MNLEQNLKSVFIEIFHSYGIRYNPKKNLEQVVLDYFTFSRKMIPQRKRSVYVSQQLSEKLFSHPKRAEIILIKNRFEQGASLLPFLSEKIFQFGFHDSMLYEWHIYHLHLSSRKKDCSKFFKRNDDLLFVYIEDENVYFLETDRHRPYVFAEKKWITIVLENWSNLMEKFKINDMVNISPDPNPQDRQILRDKGYNLFATKIKDQVFANPGLGIMTSGHSIEASLKTDKLFRWFWNLEKELEDRKTEIHEYFWAAYDLSEDVLNFQFKIDSQGLQFFETNSKHVVASFQ